MVTKDDVLKIAQLARIRLEDSQVEGVQKKFTAILDYFEFLKEANTEGVAPMFHAAEKMPLREDVPEAPLDRTALLANAPDQSENCYQLPKVVGAIE